MISLKKQIITLKIVIFIVISLLLINPILAFADNEIEIQNIDYSSEDEDYEEDNMEQIRNIEQASEDENYQEDNMEQIGDIEQVSENGKQIVRNKQTESTFYLFIKQYKTILFIVMIFIDIVLFITIVYQFIRLVDNSDNVNNKHYCMQKIKIFAFFLCISVIITIVIIFAN